MNELWSLTARLIILGCQQLVDWTTGLTVAFLGVEMGLYMLESGNKIRKKCIGTL